MAHASNPTVASWLEAYQKTFIKAWETSIEKMYAGKLKLAFKITDMFNDFESKIMEPYRKEVEKDNSMLALAPKAYAGMNQTDATFLMVSAYSSPNIPLSRAIHSRRSYESGKLRIRDMRAFVNSVMEKDASEITDFEKQAIASYSLTLRATNKDRSLGWRILHPIRNNAEKREAALFEKMLSDKFPDTYMELSVKAVAPIAEMKAQYAHIQGYKFPEKNHFIEKENISINDTDKEKKVEIAKPIEPNPSLEKENSLNK
jgi:hypothetical protein